MEKQEYVNLSKLIYNSLEECESKLDSTYWMSSIIKDLTPELIQTILADLRKQNFSLARKGYIVILEPNYNVFSNGERGYTMICEKYFKLVNSEHLT